MAYFSLLAVAAGPCCICGRADQRITVDHDHATGKSPGACSVTATMSRSVFLGDDISRLTAAIVYLKG